MKIIHNPIDGAPIRDFIFQGNKTDVHYQEGYVLDDGSISNGLKQYEDNYADKLVETFGFLEEFTEEQAKVVLERPAEPTFKCDFPGCDFVANKKIGLLGHQRKHAKELKEAEKPVVDPSIIPVAGTQKIEGHEKKDSPAIDGRATDIQNGPDKDGVDWYGEGVQVENKSNQAFGASKNKGNAHFIG